MVKYAIKKQFFKNFTKGLGFDPASFGPFSGINFEPSLLVPSVFFSTKNSDKDKLFTIIFKTKYQMYVSKLPNVFAQMPNVFVHQTKKGEGSKKGNEEKQEAAELVTDGNCCDTFFSETQLYTITHNYEQLHTKLHTGEKTLIDMATWGQVCDQYECMNVILAKLLIFVSFSKALYMHIYSIFVYYIPRKAGRWQLFQSSKKQKKFE